MTRTWTATDACGNTSTASQTISVQDTTAPAFIDRPTSIVICEGQQFIPSAPSAVDTCIGPVPCTYTRSDMPDPQDSSKLRQFTDLGEFMASFETNPLPVDGTTVTLTASASDGCGNSSSCSWTVTMTPCEKYCSYTQGYWGNAGGKGQAQSRIELINMLIGTQPIVLGTNGRTLTITGRDGECVVRRLPAGGPSAALTSGAHTFGIGDCATDLPTDSRSMKFRNNLLGQSISMALNLRFDPTLANFEIDSTFTTWSIGSLDPLNVGKECHTYTIPGNVLAALNALGLPKTVGGLMTLANLGLGNASTGAASLTEIGSSLSTINEAFDECRIWAQYGGCPTN